MLASAMRRLHIFIAISALALPLLTLAHGVSSRDAQFVAAVQGVNFMPFLYLGAKHMVTGYDHLLFLAGVIFLLYRLRDVALYASLFALGHSITLLAAVLLGYRANPYIVDAIIGLSVVYKGFENIGGFGALRWRLDPRLAVFAFGLLLPLIGFIRLHPYQYTHFNHIAGTVRSADNFFMLDYWGLALKQASDGLRDELDERQEVPPQGRKWKVAVCGPHPPARVALGDEFEPTWEPQGADFALMLGTFYCARFDAPVLVDVTHDGVSFARAYDLRGLNFTSMFTLPPVK